MLYYIMLDDRCIARLRYSVRYSMFDDVILLEAVMLYAMLLYILAQDDARGRRSLYDIMLCYVMLDCIICLYI